MQSGYRQQPPSYHSRPPGPPQGNSLLKIRTNCFKVTQIPAATYTLYDAFSPDIPKSAWRKRAELVRHLQKAVRPDVFSPQFLYDGAAIGFAHPTLCRKLGIVRMFRVRLRDNAEPKPDDKGAVEIKFKQSSAEPISPTETNAVILQGHDSPRRSSILNFLQLVLRHASNNDHPNNGKAYFPPPPPENPENRKKKIKYLQSIDNTFLELRRGVFHSVRPSMGQMIIVVDTVVAAFYQRGRMLDAMLAFFNVRRGDLRALSELSRLQLDNAGKFFRSVFIREEKGGVSGGRRTIKGFDRHGAHYQFTNSDGQEVTIEQHYRQVHNIILRYPKLPGVIVRITGDRKEILPMELCIIEPNQLFKKALPEVATREMVRFSTLGPEEKMVEIQRVSGYYQASESLVSAGMQVSRQPMDVDATQMQPPLIEFRGPSPMPVRDGKWNVVGKKLCRTTEGCHWGVINLAPTKLHSQQIQQHCMAFQKCATDLGVALGIPIHMQQVDPQSDLLEVLDKFMFVVKQKIGSEESYQEMLGKRKFFILCFLEEEASRPRATLKFWGDTQTGVATQCVRLNKLPKHHNPGSVSQYWNNVVLKVNPRLGGENSSVSQSSAFDKTFRNGGLPMIVGADVGHPSPGVRKPSVASLVYNIDRSALTYNALTALQGPRQEVIADLRAMMRAAIVDLQTRNRNAVTHIIFYRDGVSEGEYDQVKSIEIADIKNAINDVWNSSPNIQEGGFPKPKLTFIVVGKRHHTLLFPSNPAGGDRTGNCPAGVVVNTGITQPTPDIRDFYLLSHSAIIGTSRSSHYVVLLNEVFPGDTRILEELSYALCHVYAKATRSVSIPAPVYYADLVCGRESFHFAPGVEDSLRANDSGTTVSGQTVPFDLNAWKAAFKSRNLRLDGSMYFL